MDTRLARLGASLALLAVIGTAGTAVIPLKTGQNTAAPAGASPGGLLLALLGLGAAAFVIYRMRRTGQRVDLRRLLSRQFLLGTGLLVLTLAVAAWAVKTFSPPG